MMKNKAITIIAGGSKGLGAALVKTFTDENHEIIELSRSGRGSYHIDCDFINPEKSFHTFLNTFKNLHHELKEVNLIINTAVLAPFGSLKETDFDAIQQHLNININTTMLLVHAFVKSLQELPINKTITYISSGAARREIPGLAMYSASKAFFERFIDTTATEQQSSKHPIKCMIINPGVMNTDMQSEIRSQSKENFPMVDMWQDWYDNDQLANPIEIAQVCFDLITSSGKNGGYYTAQQLLK